MICATCLALEYGSEDSLRLLVQYQALQLHRLTGGTYEIPDLEHEWDDEDDEEPPTPVDAVAVVEGLLSHDDIFRKPPRAAAPRLVERLRSAGLTITHLEDP